MSNRFAFFDCPHSVSPALDLSLLLLLRSACQTFEYSFGLVYRRLLLRMPDHTSTLCICSAGLVAVELVWSPSFRRIQIIQFPYSPDQHQGLSCALCR